MFKYIKRGGAALLAVLTALLMVVTFASAASAHCGTVGGDPAGSGNFVHDDEQGRECVVGTDASATTHSANHPGTGVVDPVDNDSPADAVNVIRDYGLENAPIIIGVIGAIFLVGLTFYLVRRGLMKARGAMRL